MASLVYCAKVPEAPGLSVDVSGQLQDTLANQQTHHVFHVMYVIEVPARLVICFRFDIIYII